MQRCCWWSSIVTHTNKIWVKCKNVLNKHDKQVQSQGSQYIHTKTVFFTTSKIKIINLMHNENNCIWDWEMVIIRYELFFAAVWVHFTGRRKLRTSSASLAKIIRSLLRFSSCLFVPFIINIFYQMSMTKNIASLKNSECEKYRPFCLKGQALNRFHAALTFSLK